MKAEHKTAHSAKHMYFIKKNRCYSLIILITLDIDYTVPIKKKLSSYVLT